MDVIRAGNTLFFFGTQQLYYSHTIFRGNNLSIHIEERSVKSFFKKHILLQDINLTIEPGNMVLILGGSGAGKTTFVNAVTGYEKAKAQILQDGVDVYENYGKLKHSIGFVPQQDLLRDDDTVRNTLLNAAEMRLSKKYTEKERSERADRVLEMFGLSVQKNELVRKLSGGQRKRLSICVEFISDPKLFFLDEPDSGLDGVMAKDLMEHLRKIADQDKIVLVITHTPDRVIDLFDKVIVLAKGTKDHIGHLAFYGGISEAREFFGKETMEEIVLAVNGVNEGGEGRADEFIEKFKMINPEETAHV
ncbi:ABC transporter ATP-binding protein [Blautia sp. MSJ-19]|nr:ABC transporter ATP-binding protein [Blautia sp. MSJ-19]